MILSLSDKIKRIHWYGDAGYMVMEDDVRVLLDAFQAYIIYQLLRGKKSYNILLFELLKVIDEKSDFIEETLKRLLKNFKGIINTDERMPHNDSIKVSGKPYLFFPFSIQLSLTNKCNLLCNHCFREATTKGKEIDYDNLVNFFDYIKDSTPYITLTGGEPLLYSHFDDLVKNYANNFNFALTTTGYAKFKIETLKKFKIVQYTLQGSNAEEHDNFVNKAGSFKTCLNNLKSLIDCGVDIIVTTQAKNDSIEDMRKFIEMCIDNKVKEIVIGEISEIGRAKKKLDFTAYNFQVIQEKISFLAEEYKEKILIVCDNEEQSENINHHFFGCGAGCLEWFISEDAKIFPCSYFQTEDFYMGNFDLHTARNLVNSPIIYELNKKWSNIDKHQLKSYAKICENINIEGIK